MPFNDAGSILTQKHGNPCIGKALAEKGNHWEGEDHIAKPVRANQENAFAVLGCVCTCVQQSGTPVLETQKYSRCSLQLQYDVGLPAVRISQPEFLRACFIGSQ
jgi:hypothetical protein